MLTDNIWSCTAQAFSDGIWAKDPLGSKYQFYQYTYCLFKDIGNKIPLTFILFIKQIRSKVYIWNYLITWRKHGIVILKIKQHVSSSHLVTETFVWGCVWLSVFISSFYCDQGRIIKKERPRENPLFYFDNNDSKAGLHLNIKGNINLN